MEDKPSFSLIFTKNEEGGTFSTISSHNYMFPISQLTDEGIYQISKNNNRVLNSIPKARPQLPVDIPAVIHIAVPYEHSSRLVDFIDHAYNNVYKYINESTKRIAAVVATSKLIQSLIFNHSSSNGCTQLQIWNRS